MIDAGELLRLAQSSHQTNSNAATVRNSQISLADIQANVAAQPVDDGGGVFDFVKSLPGRALDALDTPRAAITSTIKESIDLAQGEGFSFDDWWNQTSDNYGFGELIEEETDIENIWVKRGLGLVGDVLLDPTTYLGGASVVNRLGRTGLAGRAFDLGADELAQKVLRGGVSAASADDLKFLSRGNDVVNALPELENAKGVFLGGRIKLTEFGSGTLLYDKIASPVRKHISPKVNSLLGGQHAGAKALLINGTPQESREAFLTIRRTASESGRLAPFVAGFEREAAQIISGLDDESDRLLQQALGGNVDAIEALNQSHGPELLERVQAFTARLVDDGNRHVRQANPNGTRDVFSARENWQPTARTPEFTAYLANTGQREGGSALQEGFEQRAGLVAGSRFLGRELLDPKDHVDGSDIRTQVRNIIAEEQREFGSEHLVQLFDERFSVSIAAHLKSYGSAVRRHSIAEGLVADGVAEPLFESVLDGNTFEDAAALAKADLALDDFARQGQRNTFDAEAAADAGRRDVAGRPQISVDEYTDIQERLSKLRGARFRLNREPLDAAGRRELARVQQDINRLGRDAAHAEASLTVGQGIDLPEFLPGGAVRGEAVGGRFSRTGVGYEPDPNGAWTFSLGDVAVVDGELTDELRDELAGAGFTGARTPNGIEPLSGELVNSFAPGAPPGFMVDVDNHIGQVHDRVVASQARLTELADEIGFNPDSLTPDAETAVLSRAQNRELLDSLDGSADPSRRMLAERAERAFADAENLEGEVADAARLSAQADAGAARFGDSTMDTDQMLKALKRRDFQETLSFNMRSGFSKLSNGVQAPDHVVEAINGAAKLFEDDGSKLIEAWDRANRAFKTYAILTPGFHSRNFVGGVVNNFLADVDLGTTPKFTNLYRQYRGELRKGADPLTASATIAERHGADGQAFAQAVQFGAVGGGIGPTSEIGLTLRGAADGVEGANRSALRRQGLVDNSVTRASFRAGEAVEDTLRGTLFFDRILKGATTDEALADVAKFHFDYDDLSQFERQVARRVVPFYTWSRKNLPLQIEGMLTNPKAYNAFGHVKRNVELGVEEEQTVPSYVEEALHIRLPFELPGGRAYLLPSLPFQELTRTVDPGEIFGSTTPFLRVPFERQFERKTFNNVPFRLDPQEVPSSWPGIGRALEAVGFAEEVNGKFYARDKDLHTIEQALPVLGRLRRTLPSDSDEGFKDRQLTTAINFFTGAGLFTNTERAQQNELFGREIDQRDADKYLSGLAALAEG